MRVGLETAIIAFIILSRTSFSAASTIKVRSNPLGIDWDPAPSAEDGPPGSVNALRNPAFLPAEISGIVGAYVLVVIVTSIALLIIGRRVRRKGLSKILDVELIQPTVGINQFYPSPVTPASPRTRNFSWPSPEKTDRNPYIFPSTYGSPISPGSDPAVDARVVEADKAMLNRDLEDLYAHVMEQEEAKAAGISVSEMPQPAYAPMPAVAPQRQNMNNKLGKARPAGIDTDQSKADNAHSRTSSLMSSLKSPRKGIRGMRISSPIPTPLTATFPASYMSDEEPLSPRRYQELPPPPPVPKDQVPYSMHSHSRSNSSNPSSSSNDPSPISPTYAPSSEETGPLSYPMRNLSLHTLPSSPSPARPNAPPPLSIPKPKTTTFASAPSRPSTNGSTTRALPFRAFDPPATPSSFAGQSSSTKTTILERRPHDPSALRTGGLNSALRTPWTNAPYSPYMPKTPLIPVTPRLVTREERKMKEKFDKHKPVLEMVGSEDEVWDSAY